MLNQRRRAIEGLATIRAAVGAAWQVGACMDGQHRALTKALAALRTLERLLTGMASGMGYKCRSLGKALATDATTEGPLPSVHSLVTTQG